MLIGSILDVCSCKKLRKSALSDYFGVKICLFGREYSSNWDICQVSQAKISKSLQSGRKTPNTWEIPQNLAIKASISRKAQIIRIFAKIYWYFGQFSQFSNEFSKYLGNLPYCMHIINKIFTSTRENSKHLGFSKKHEFSQNF